MPETGADGDHGIGSDLISQCEVPLSRVGRAGF